MEHLPVVCDDARVMMVVSLSVSRRTVQRCFRGFHLGRPERHQPLLPKVSW